ncbi:PLASMODESMATA CALLOSE-BINDING PROTEIN 2 [Apium graveolens]|uniref:PLASMODESMATA CALLOSE-BINDING PROTEIN 2 n=1 Tax=Apium graveolens TaxID=4045 RepID=UPI003D791A44
MARLVLVMLLLVMAGHASANWCVCKQGQSESVLQKTLDYACGAGADCNPIHQNGVCFNPNTVLAHCNYAVNSYYQRKGQAPTACDFAGAGAVVTSDPSITGCVYPSSASATTNTGTNTNTPTINSPASTTTTPLGGSPYVTTPGNGVLGGVGSGLGPSGVGINNDDSHAGLTRRQNSSIFWQFVAIMFTMLGFLWG